MSVMEHFGFFLSRTFARTKPIRREWPYIPGKYYIVDREAPVAVATLGSVQLAADLANAAAKGLCIAGKLETENIGIEKIIKNTLSNPAIRFLICAGSEVPTHRTGATMVSLFLNGIDARKRILGAPGKRPVLPNCSTSDVDAFRHRIEPIDMIDCTDPSAILARISEVTESVPDQTRPTLPVGQPDSRERRPRITASAPPPHRIKLDDAGYFVITIEDRAIVVEHYDYRDNLLHVIEATTARAMYWTLIDRGWVTRLDHAAYLGKELSRAELSMRQGRDFVQDGA